jgi:hypothetical protein
MAPLKARVALDPENSHRARAFYYCRPDAPSGHPETTMRKLADRLGFRILASIPESLFDGWDLWIAFDGAPPSLPAYFIEVAWKPVGQSATWTT